jgi:hypothetical protein
MKKLFLLWIASCFFLPAIQAQMDLPPSGGNPRATITEEVGITSITIKYSRPDVNKREGQIWGKLITYGFTSSSLDNNLNNKPWRAGANENTTISFEHDVKVEGKNLKAGTYGLHMAVWPDSVVIIFSNDTEAWGSFYYNDRADALRVTVKPVALDKSVEYLKYEFIEHKEKYCVIALQWEKLSIPFKVDVDVDNIVIARLRDQVSGQRGFNATLLQSAANYCLNKNINLEEALGWAQRAGAFRSYSTFRTLAIAYEKLNRLREADSVMKDALDMANANQYGAYSRTLITQKRSDKAIEVMLAGKTRFGDVIAVNNNLMFAYSAKGDFKNALVYANKAMANLDADKVMTPANKDAAKKTLDGQIAKLKEGKDINQ